MCGIVGYCSTKPIQNKQILLAQRDALQHRGPDDLGVWWSNDLRIGLAHRRLAIIDTSSYGHQPMLDESSRYCITFNGEIYNYKSLRNYLKGKGHKFRSSSDTEVVLASFKEWGDSCVQHFNGMFSFGLYDKKRRRLFLARDRAGEKPLFYKLSSNEILFGSTLKALLVNESIERHLDYESLDYLLAYGYIPGHRCILRGINKLPPAHALIFDIDTGKTKIWQYWHLPDVVDSIDINDGFKDEQILLDELDSLLEDSVTRQLVADVPVGILLSGGLDSSIITAMASRSTNNFKTFTIRFPENRQYDETKHARLIANYFQTEHIELEATSSSVNLLPMLAKQFDEPIVDSSMIPTYLVCDLISQHCKVALGGDGGDELFGGYKHYNRLVWLQQRLKYLPNSIKEIISGLAELVLPYGLKGRYWLQAFNTDFKNGLPLAASFFSKKERQTMIKFELNGHHVVGCNAEDIRRQQISSNSCILQRATRMDFENYLAEDILVKVDRASMLNSLEVRSPFLDYRIIEFAFSKVHSSLKATATNRKVLLKKLASRVLPPNFDIQRKQGFAIPLDLWLKGPEWGDYFKQVLYDDTDSGIFDKHFIDNLLNGPTRGYINSERLFSLVLFKLWLKEYKIQF
jgi:asparagine synthase (glutamine-hydrolysing)